jgi:hypothetical protein
LYTGYYWGPTANDGSESVWVSPGLPTGSDYRVRLMWSENHSIGDYSESFAVAP